MEDIYVVVREYEGELKVMKVGSQEACQSYLFMTLLALIDFRREVKTLASNEGYKFEACCTTTNNKLRREIWHLLSYHAN